MSRAYQRISCYRMQAIKHKLLAAGWYVGMEILRYPAASISYMAGGYHRKVLTVRQKCVRDIPVRGKVPAVINVLSAGISSAGVFLSTVKDVCKGFFLWMKSDGKLVPLKDLFHVDDVLKDTGHILFNKQMGGNIQLSRFPGICFLPFLRPPYKPTVCIEYNND